MRWSVAPIVLLSACLVTPSGVSGRCVDRDRDGVCDAADPCPNAEGDDADGDGVCDGADVCPLGPDDEDADEDGIADACDTCPDDPAEDPDEDGLCGDLDPCPDDPDDACVETLVVAVQVDVFPEEATWSVVNQYSQPLASGAFSENGEGGFHEVVAGPNDILYVTLEDGFSDGGIRGMVFSRKRGERLAGWSADSYGRLKNVQVDVGTRGQPFTPPREDVWVRRGRCDVRVDLDLGAYPTEVSWTLQTPSGRVLLDVPDGAYTEADSSDRANIRLVEGDYQFIARDAYGDGWAGDGAAFELSIATTGGVVLGDTLDGGFEGTWDITVDCP